jgi:hypothetical protein
MDLLRANVEASKPDNDAIRQQGLGQALAQFGFKMAANAAKPGARFLESAASASPELSDAAAKTQDLMAARQKNYQDMQMRQAQFEIQFNNGNMKDATMLAAQLRQQQQADKLFQFHIADAMDKQKLEEKKLAQTGAYYGAMASKYENVSSLTKDIMQNEGLPYDKAIEKAGNILKGGIPAGIRSSTSDAANLDKRLKDIAAQQKYSMLAFYKPDNPKYAPLKAEYDAEVRAAYANHGGGGASISDAAPAIAAPPSGWGPAKVKP